MKALGFAAAALVWTTAAALADEKPTVLWEATGLKTPESVQPDLAGAFAYVSNVDGEPLEKDGNGFISKVSLADGKVIEPQWVTGLDAPKGLGQFGNRLYVSDIDQLVEIDTETGKILNRYPAADAKFLNDVAVDSDGRIYVSDMQTNKIWRLADGKFEVLIDSPELRYPNGLYVKDGELIVAAWGQMTESEAEKPGNLLVVSLADNKIKNLGDGTPIGHLDGLVRLSEGEFLATDWMAGGVFRIDASGKAEKLLTLNPGSADISYVPAEQMLLVPMMKDDKLFAYKLE